MTSKPLILGFMAGALLGSAGLADMSASAATGELPRRVLLMGYGTNVMRDGRPPILLKDRAQAEKVVAATQQRLGSTKFMFDYDHEAVKIGDPKVMGQAIAAGWGDGFEVDDRGIWVKVEWTEAAAAKIAAKEYLYVSPCFHFNKKTGELVDFINAAIVNRPALELEALAASLSGHQEEEDTMNLKAIAAALGLPEDSDEAAVLAAIAKNGETLKAVSAALKAKDGDDLAATAASIVVRAAASAPDPMLFVPRAAFEDLQATVASLQEKDLQGEVDEAVESGKLAPAMKEWGMDLIRKDRAAFASFVDNSPVLATGRSGPAGQGGGGAGALDETDEAVCAMLGVDSKDYLETRKQEAA
jgi:phage I-like protein